MLQISVFADVNHLPKSKEEKIRLSAIVANTIPKVVSVDSLDDIIDVVTENAWSPSIFNGRKINDNFLHTDFMVLDIDDGMTMEEAEDIVDSMKVYALIMPSTSHTESFHKFRVILPLSRRISSNVSFSATWNYLGKYFTKLDIQCKDVSRFYFGCQDEFILIEEDDYELLEPVIVDTSQSTGEFSGKTVKVKKYETKNILEIIYPDKKDIKEIPETIDKFLTLGPNGGINKEGTSEWWRILNDFSFTLGLLGKEYEEAINIVATIAPEELDGFDLQTIDRAYYDGEANRD